MTMYIVDGGRLLRRAYDLDRDSERNYRLCHSLNAQMIRIKPALYKSGARHSSGECFFVAFGADLGIGHRVDSMLPIPVDGAGGLRLR